MPSLTAALLSEHFESDFNDYEEEFESFHEEEEYDAGILEEYNAEIIPGFTMASPPPSPRVRPTLVHPESTEGSRVVEKLKNFFSLPPSATTTDLYRLANDHWYGSSRYIPQAEAPLPKHIIPTIQKTGKPRSRELLRRVSSVESMLSKAGIFRDVSTLDWSKVEADFFRKKYATIEVPSFRAAQAWEDEASARDKALNKPKTTTRVVQTIPTISEWLAYQDPELKNHRVSIQNLSPLRNETIVEDIIAEEEDWDAVGDFVGLGNAF
jgi:hypothetical protein